MTENNMKNTESELQRYKMLAQYLTALFVCHDEFEKTPDYINESMERMMDSAREYDEKLIPRYLLKQSER